MKIAKIVSSNSHIAYIARVLEARDGDDAPSSEDRGFGRFVKVPGDGTSAIGIVCDTRLVNPEYQYNSPRMASMPTLGELARDLADENKALIGILLLGTLEPEGNGIQEIPRRSIASGQFVFTMDGEEVRRFHRNADGSVQLKYLPDLLANAGALAVPLAKAAIDTVSEECSEADRRRLSVLYDALSWRHTFGGLKV
ncbi:MAG: hypothetical protein AB7Q37_00700 [Pyrinomonadaceae bacterium]